MLYKQIDMEIDLHGEWALRRQKGIPNNRRLWVLACMDERLPVEEALGIRIGDAHVFRNAGGLVTDDAIRSAALTTNFFGTEEIIVVNHTECGMMSATGNIVVDALKEKHKIDPKKLPIDSAVKGLGNFPDEKTFTEWFRMFDDVDATCEKQVQLLREHPLIPDEVVIHGYIYEVESRHLRKPYQRVSERVNTARQTGAKG